MITVGDILKQMRGLYARANSVLRMFAACSFEVKLRPFQAFCTSFYKIRYTLLISGEKLGVQLKIPANIHTLPKSIQ